MAILQRKFCDFCDGYYSVLFGEFRHLPECPTLQVADPEIIQKQIDGEPLDLTPEMEIDAPTTITVPAYRIDELRGLINDILAMKPDQTFCQKISNGMKTRNF